MQPLRPLAVAFALAAATVSAQRPAPLPADRAAGATTIAREDLETWLTALTAEEMRGRGTGTRGFELAAELVRDHFAALGLEPLDETDGYLLRVPWTRHTIDPSATKLQLERNGEVLFELTAAAGLVASGTTDSDSSAPLAVAAYRGDAGELESLDADGCHVLVVAETPLDGMGDYYRVSRALRRAGASLLAVVDSALAPRVPAGDATTPSLPESRVAFARGQRPRVFVLERQHGDLLLAHAGVTAAALAEADGCVRAPGITATARVVAREEPAPAFNVAGVLRGSDPDRREEYVVVGSHLDHLGVRGDDVYPGADDDASGTAAVMALARAFARNPERPRRSLLFVTFCGEERGLIGSSHFAANPPVPLGQIAAELQVDMIGRCEEGPGESADQNRNSLHLIGTQKLSADLHELCLRLNRERARFDLEWDEEDIFYRSDHWNFAREGVPVAFFFTGFHPDYHQPTDTADKIDYDKLRRVALYVYDVAFELAQADQRPFVDLAWWQALDKKGRRTPVAPVRE